SARHSRAGAEQRGQCRHTPAKREHGSDLGRPAGVVADVIDGLLEPTEVIEELRWRFGAVLRVATTENRIARISGTAMDDEQLVAKVGPRLRCQDAGFVLGCALVQEEEARHVAQVDVLVSWLEQRGVGGDDRRGRQAAGTPDNARRLAGADLT